MRTLFFHLLSVLVSLYRAHTVWSFMFDAMGAHVLSSFPHFILLPLLLHEILCSLGLLMHLVDLCVLRDVFEWMRPEKRGRWDKLFVFVLAVEVHVEGREGERDKNALDDPISDQPN